MTITQNPRSQQPTGVVKNVPLLPDGEIQLIVRSPKPDGFILFGNSLLDPNNPEDAVIRLRLSSDKIFLAAGEARRIKKDYGKTEYSYPAHPNRKRISASKIL